MVQLEKSSSYSSYYKLNVMRDLVLLATDVLWSIFLHICYMTTVPLSVVHN